MNRDDIIRWAREAGWAVRCLDGIDEVMEGDYYHIQTDEVERFAALAYEAGAAAEREAIAKRFDGPVWSYDYREIAAAIRARGENKV